MKSSTPATEWRSLSPSEERLTQALRGDLSWLPVPDGEEPALLSAATAHGVEALVWHALPSEASPAAALRERLGPAARQAVAREMLAHRELDAVLRALHEAGVQALLLKGAALAYSSYREPWHRPRTDVDLLVAQAQVQAAERALAAIGYARSDALSTGRVVSHQIALSRIDRHALRHVIDLHWKIVNPQILADALRFDDLWARRRPAPAAGQFAHVPAPVDNALIAAIHRLAHHQGHERLIWLYDVRLLTTNFSDAEWDELASTACRRSVAAMSLDALREAQRLLDAPLPPHVTAVLESAAVREPSHRYVEGRVRKLDVLESDLRTLTSWRDRWTLLREHAFPPAAFIRQRYGIHHPLLLPALYLHRLVVGAVKWVR